MRIFLAIKAFFKILFNRDFGQEVLAITDGTSEELKTKVAETDTLADNISNLKEQLRKSEEERGALTADLQNLSAAAITVKQDLEHSLLEIDAMSRAEADKETKLNGELSVLHSKLKESFETVALAQTNVEKLMATSANGPAILLSLLQREGRLIDFMMEDIKDFDDSQVGAAIRPVHSGCQKVFTEYVKISSIEKGDEGDKVTVKDGFDPFAIKLTGKVKGTPPFKGVLQHHGWIIEELKLPPRPESHTAEVITPAEIEIG